MKSLQTSLISTLFITVVYGGIIGIFHELSDRIKSDLEILVANGKFDVFESVIVDYGLDQSNNAALTLWDYICSIQDGDTCAAFGSSTVGSQGLPAFAQLEMYGGATFAGPWSTIEFNSISLNKGISYNQSTAEIKFDISGVYKCTIGYRGGQASGDQWNGIRVRNVDSDQTVGLSNAAGNIGTSDSTQHSFTFLFEISNILDGYVIQKGRRDASSIVIQDALQWQDGSEDPASLVAVIEFVGSL